MLLFILYFHLKLSHVLFLLFLLGQRWPMSWCFTWAVMPAGRAPPTGARRRSTRFYKHRSAISAKGRQLYANHSQYSFSHVWKQPEEGAFITAVKTRQVSVKNHFRSPFSGFLLNFMDWKSGWPTPRGPISPEELFVIRNLHKNDRRYRSVLLQRIDREICSKHSWSLIWTHISLCLTQWSCSVSGGSVNSDQL